MKNLREMSDTEIVKMVKNFDHTVYNCGGNVHINYEYISKKINAYQFRECETFITMFCSPTKTITNKTSYNYKHLVENLTIDEYGDHKYIYEGAFMITALLLGYNLKLKPLESSSPMFNIHFNKKLWEYYYGK